MSKTRAALFLSVAFLSAPAVAQDAPAAQTVTPPPILVTPAPAPAPAPRVVEMAPSSPIVQPAPPPGPREPVAAEAAPERPAPTRRTARAAAPAREAAPAPRAAAQAVPAAPAAPVAQSPAPAAESPTAPVAAAPAPAAPAAETTAPAETASNQRAIWPWVLGGLVVLAGLAALLLMRRRREDAFVEEPSYEPEAPRAYAEPVAPAYEPVAPRAVQPRHEPEVSPFMAATAHAAPLAAEPAIQAAEAHSEVELAEPESEDLAGVTDAPAPVANRPWLEFGLRPVRAGTSDEEAVVDVELTVGNAGDTPARDVRISTFLLADSEAGEMENMLIDRGADASVPPVTIAPGDGTRVDAHLAVPKGEVGRVFNPVVIAEARYTLPDGREGRTSAAFKIGRPSPVSDGVGPIGATRPHMVEDVEAELLGTPEHA